jgi:hypothetical protein
MASPNTEILEAQSRLVDRVRALLAIASFIMHKIGLQYRGIRCDFQLKWGVYGSGFRLDAIPGIYSYNKLACPDAGARCC